MKLPPVLVYTVLRLLAFLVPLGILLLFPLFQQLPWLAAVFAALIGLSLSVLFLRRPLDRVSAQVQQRRTKQRTKQRPAENDEDIEDAANRALSSDTATPTATATATAPAPPEPGSADRAEPGIPSSPR